MPAPDSIRCNEEKDGQGLLDLIFDKGSVSAHRRLMRKSYPERLNFDVAVLSRDIWSALQVEAPVRKISCKRLYGRDMGEVHSYGLLVVGCIVAEDSQPLSSRVMKG